MIIISNPSVHDINVEKLVVELGTIPHFGFNVINSVAYVYLDDSVTVQQKANAIAILAAHTTTLSAAQIAKQNRYDNSKSLALSVDQLHNSTAAQVSSYVTAQISNGVVEADAITAINNAFAQATPALVLAALKPIIINIVHAQYRTLDILVLVGKILVALRDYLWPDMQDL